MKNELIEAYRQYNEPDEAAVDRVWQRLESEDTRAPRYLWPWLAAAVAAAAVVAFGLGGSRAWTSVAGSRDGTLAGHSLDGVEARDRTAPGAGSRGAAAAVTPEVTDPSTPADPEPIGEVPSESEIPEEEPTPTDPPVRARPGATDDGATSEVELVGRAQALLRDGKPRKSLALLRQHRRRFASGTLREDADALRILALCDAGQERKAAREAVVFLAAHPSSPHANRVRGSCAVE